MIYVFQDVSLAENKNFNYIYRNPIFVTKNNVYTQNLYQSVWKKIGKNDRIVGNFFLI